MAQIKADEISQILREQIANYDSKVRVDEVGTIISLGDGIARLHGLDKVMAGELLAFPHGIAGLAMSLEEDQVGAVRRSVLQWWRSRPPTRCEKGQSRQANHGHPCGVHLKHVDAPSKPLVSRDGAGRLVSALCPDVELLQALTSDRSR